MKHIRLGFCDFDINWGSTGHASTADPYRYFLNLLKTDFDVELVGRWDGKCFRSTPADHPDFVICSDPGTEHLNFSCPKIFYSCELRGDRGPYDWAFSFRYNKDSRVYRMPWYPILVNPETLIQPKPPIEELLNRKFCCVVLGRQVGSYSPREDFFQELSRYKKVDSAGRRLNNIGHTLPMERGAKIEFCKNYKFTMAFENMSAIGYTTEKLPEAMQAHSVGLYWGNPQIGLDFNERSFVNCGGDGNERMGVYNRVDYAAIMDRIIQLDSNDDEYAKIVAEPYYVNNEIPAEVRKENILAFFHRIFD